MKSVAGRMEAGGRSGCGNAPGRVLWNRAVSSKNWAATGDRRAPGTHMTTGRVIRMREDCDSLNESTEHRGIGAGDEANPYFKASGGS